MKKINIIILVAIVLAIIGIAISIFYKTPKNVVKTEVNPKQETQIVYLRDTSVKAYGQSMILVSQRNKLLTLQDSIAVLIAERAKLVPQSLVAFSQNAQYAQKLGKYEDSLSSLIDSLIILKTNNSMVIYQDLLNNKRFNYSINDKWFNQKGSFDLKGNIKIDTLNAKSSPYVILGEKGGFLKRKTITAIVGDKNPNISVDSLHTFQYKSKPTWEFSIGPQILTNLKQTSIGAGVTLKKGVFSVSVGYLLPNK